MGLQIQYESVEDASLRLRGSVVLYDGAPVYVEGVNAAPPEDAKEIFRVHFRNLPIGDNGPQRKYISSRKFDLAPFKMGFLNTDKGAVYCSRSPARQQSQGLVSKNFVAEAVPPGDPVKHPFGGAPRAAQGISFEDFIMHSNVPKMVAGEYPLFAEACANAAKGVSTAFARELCVAPDPDLPFLLYLYHKTTKVGVVNIDKTVTLGPKRKCLKELLAEKNVKVRE